MSGMFRSRMLFYRNYFSTIDGINGGEDYEKIESARTLGSIGIYS